MIKKIIPIGICSLAATSLQGAGLLDYDAAIAGSGFTARSIEATTFDDSNSQSTAFDFGAISGSSTFEFILTGDPNLDGRTGQDAFLAVATGNSANSLRYEQWDNTGQLGFTRSGVADHTFTALEAASPTTDTHVAYRWTSDTNTMDLFINGALVDTVANAEFDMPSGPGLLGNNEGGNEGMVGTIHRVTTFDSALSEADISSHAIAFTGIPEPSSILLSSIAALALLRRKRL